MVNPEHLILFWLIALREPFIYAAALMFGFSVAYQISNAIVKALTPNEPTEKGG